MMHAMILAMAAGPLAIAQPPADPRPSPPAPPPPADGPGCYADCNRDHRLDVNDFVCFQSSLGFCGEPGGGDCNHDLACNVLDFICFMQAFAAGCSDL